MCPFSLGYCGRLQLAGNKAFCMNRSAVLLWSINTSQCGGFAMFACNTATGAFMVMSRVGKEEASAAHKNHRQGMNGKQSLRA